LIIYNNFIIN